jgi:hypothetical protein
MQMQTKKKVIRSAWWFAFAAGLGGSASLVTACTDDPAIVEPAPPPAVENPLASGADFVAIPRRPDAAARAKLAAKGTVRALPPTDGQEFYVAIRRSALADRYFLSAFLDQYFPGGVDAAAATTLGTRVVTYREQNDKLYVFDASEGNGLGPVFNPEVVIEAYPIVQAYDPFDSLANSSAYVLIDPSAGLNKFDVVSDAWAPAGYETPVKFEVELSFLQHFRRLADGVSYQQVFTGYTDKMDPDGTGDTSVHNTFQASGTLTISLRKYKEGTGFVAQPATLGDYFFKTGDRHNTQSGAIESFATRWNIHPGMQPIKWKISRELPAYLAAHPELADADIVGAVKRGIEGWNDVFGYQVFKAELAGPDDAFGDDDRNFFIFDPYPGVGYARANWRTNPLTGEIRGASVYLGAGWLNLLRFSDDDPAAAGAPPAPAPAHHKVGLRWAGVGEDDLCTLFADDDQLPVGPGAGSLTAAQKLALYVQHVVTHEVGHNLGLRHNFKGSLVPPSSSVMDYTLTPDRVATPAPGSYDVAAIRLLYGLSSDVPSDPFCTDSGVATDPECRKFDAGDAPLYSFFAPRVNEFYSIAMAFYGFDADWLDWASEGVLAYARAPSDIRAVDAYELVMAPVRAPLDAGVLASMPLAGPVADGSSRVALETLFGLRPSAYAVVTNLPTDEGVIASAVHDLRGNLANLDGVRSFETRRSAVDVLKKLQRVDAYRVLLDVRAQLAAQLADGTLFGDDVALSTDLLARIDAAISPYFLH